MFYALAHLEDTFFAEHLYKALMFAPCLVLTDVVAMSGTLDQLTYLMDKGVYSVFGPNWETNKEKMCEHWPQELCESYKSFEFAATGMPLKSYVHWNQNTAMSRFQEFSDGWAEGKKETELIPVQNIDEVPITMFIAPNDQACLVETALEYEKQIGSWTKNIMIEGAGHEYFMFAGDEWFMDTLIDEMQKDNLITVGYGDWIAKVGDSIMDMFSNLFMEDKGVFGVETGTAAIIAAVAALSF